MRYFSIIQQKFLFDFRKEFSVNLFHSSWTTELNKLNFILSVSAYVVPTYPNSGAQNIFIGTCAHCPVRFITLQNRCTYTTLWFLSGKFLHWQREHRVLLFVPCLYVSHWMSTATMPARCPKWRLRKVCVLCAVCTDECAAVTSARVCI